ncbi:MAG: hypothetical protein V4506_13250 [Bacteroidota bacterium]
MLKPQFIDIIRQPQQIESAQVAELELIVKEYPFFESAHLLYTKGLHKYNALNYSKQLRKTAIVANSRTVLYELLHPKEPVIKQQTVEVTETKVAIVDIEKTQGETKPVVEEIENTLQTPLKPVNPVSITDTEIKIVYINTVPKTTEPVAEKEKEPELIKKEIEIIQTIENETEVPVNEFNEDQLNKAIGDEITRGVIQSYVETEIIKTPELAKEEPVEPLSFTDWLNRVQKEAPTLSKEEKKEVSKPVQKEEKQLKNDKKPSNLEQNKNIIDKIIESDPGRIKLGSGKFFTPATDAKQSLLENEHLVTETLAKIYALQGNISKAIRAYEILSLKFPQKSVYFASLIEKLKTNK